MADRTQDPRQVLFGRIGQAAGAPASRAGHVGLRRAGEVFELPQAGSPLMAQLVRFVQARNPAVAVNESNVGEYLEGAFDRSRRYRGGFPWSMPGPGRDLVRGLIGAGLMRAPQAASVSPAWFSGSPGLRAMAVARNNLRRTLGLPYVHPYVGTSYPGDVMWQPPAAAPAAPQVPVATLPEAQVPLTSGGTGVQASPLAMTPAGPMFYPPGPSPLGSRDPRRR